MSEIDDDWVSAGDLVAALYRARPDSSAFNAIKRRAGAGLLLAKGTHLLVNGISQDDTTIPKQFWLVSSPGLQGDWKAGELSAFIPVDGLASRRNHLQAFGVLFDRAGALEMGALFPVHTVVAEAPATQSRGRKTNAANWTRFAIALAVWVHRRNDDEAGIASVGPDELLAALDQIAMDDLGGSLPRSTYQQAAGEFLEQFRKYAGN